MKKTGNIVMGILFIAVGLILGLNAFGITSINIFFDGWWTLFIIVPCVIGLFNNYDKSGDIIGICIGVFLLLCCQDVLNFYIFWKLLVPIIIVAIGIKMIFGNLFGNQGNDLLKQIETEKGTVKTKAVTFSGSNLDFTGEVFDGAKLDAVFGGIKCDLRGAIINEDCVISASATFGGIDIYVPAGLNVQVNSNSIFGGVSGKDHRNSPANEHTLYVNATCLFGGVDIK